MDNLLTADQEIFNIIKKEQSRQDNEINLIASENYVEKSVLEATGSILTNKYAEGYPSKRYYGGCQFVDEAETLAIERCKQLFGVEHANVQAHSGSQANMAVYFSILQPGDTILGMKLSEGGHLTHGHSVSFSGRLYKSISYGVNRETEELDYNEIERLALEHKPKLIIAGASAYSRYIDFEKFEKIAKKVGAYFMADIAHIAGLIATGLHQNPAKYADFITSTTHKTLRGPRGGLIMAKKDLGLNIDKSIMPGMQGGPFMNVIAAKAVAFKLALQPEFKEYQKQVLSNAKTMVNTFKALGYRIVSGGTDNHLFLIDLRSKNITGRMAQEILSTAGIYLNMNTIPFDPEKPSITSGIRIGTPAVTTRGMGNSQMEQIVHLIDEALKNKDDAKKLENIKKKGYELCQKFPINSDINKVKIDSLHDSCAC